jgi:FkbM family methyltransferase
MDMSKFVSVPATRGAYYYYGGLLFAINDQLVSVSEVANDYRFGDIAKRDVVLDVGANIGAFTMLAAKKAKKVFAVEPLYHDVLAANLKANGINNVEIVERCLGTGRITIAYGKRRKTVRCVSLADIIKQCGGHVDFLKMDCEGGEWSVKPHELRGIRRIEGELHNFDGTHDFNDFGKMLESAGFAYKFTNVTDKFAKLHARRRIVRTSRARQAAPAQGQGRRRRRRGKADRLDE